jgi:hypothetical protein
VDVLKNYCIQVLLFPELELRCEVAPPSVKRYGDIVVEATAVVEVAGADMWRSRY